MPTAAAVFTISCKRLDPTSAAQLGSDLSYLRRAFHAMPGPSSEGIRVILEIVAMDLYTSPWPLSKYCPLLCK